LGADDTPQAGPGQGYPDYPLAPTNGNISGPGPDGQLRDPSTTLGQVYKVWETEIPPLFEPLRDLPDPAGFQGLADAVRSALSQISTSGNAGSSNSTGSDPSNIAYDGNTTLGLIEDTAQKLNGWHGQSASAFAAYLNTFNRVVGNQALAGEVLRVTLLEEKELWTRMRHDSMLFITNAHNAFADAGDISLKDALSAFETISQVLGYFPVFSPITGAIDKATSVTNLLVDTFGGSKPPEPNPLSGGLFEVLANCREHRDKMLEISRTVEGDIKQSLLNLKSHIDAAPKARPSGGTDEESYTVDRPAGVYDADSVDDFVGGYDKGEGEIAIEPWEVREAASNLVDKVGPELAAAGDSFDDGDSAAPWSRGSSEVGVGFFGCYSQYSAASYALQKEIDETALEFQWAGEMLRVVADEMEKHDDNVGAGFGEVRKKIDEHDNPAPVVPNYPPGYLERRLGGI
jgi:hypothetical protein